MKLSFWYVLRSVRRRPKRYITLAAVSASVMLVMILVILWSEAEWRAKVMPDNENNYHFAFYNLTEADKEYIRRQDWVQATYDIYYNEEYMPEPWNNHFRVRVTWDHVSDALSLARQVMVQLNLFEKEPYVRSYSREKEAQIEAIKAKWMGAEEKNGMTAEEVGIRNARSNILRTQVKNRDFLRLTQDSYTMQPSFFFKMAMMALFLGGATTILMLETYRDDFREYGTLRAIGFTKGHIFYVNLLYTGCVSLAAIPLAIGTAYAAIQIYYRLIAPYRDSIENLYFTISDNVPISTLLLCSFVLLLSALLGTLVVCWIYRTKSILSLLREQGTFVVSFVSKTSRTFVNSAHIHAYNKLYLIRARNSLIRYAVIIAVMMPFPMFYLQTGVLLLYDLSTPEAIVQAIYNAFQIVTILITTLCVTCAASRLSIRTRTRELAVFRALGASHQDIRRVTYPVAACQGCVILIAALMLNLILSSITTTTYIDSREGAIQLNELFINIATYSASAIVFVLPSVFSGILMFLPGFFRRPIISSLRNSE